MEKPEFSPQFFKELEKLFTWRRDVRHFKKNIIPEHILQKLLDMTCLTPSVGLSEPWRFVRVENKEMRRQVRENFQYSHQKELAGQKGKNARLYASLKLAGLDEAPHHIAIFCVADPKQGKGLGRQTMPQTTTWSAIMAIYTFWLAATALNIGVGWVSILNPNKVKYSLHIAPDWQFLGYLCVGYPQSYKKAPELQNRGWEQRNPKRHRWITR